LSSVQIELVPIRTMPLVAVQRFLGEKQQFHRGRAPREIHLNLCARRILEARERLGRISRIPDGSSKLQDKVAVIQLLDPIRQLSALNGGIG
jgi:hypothetical protein